MSDMDRVADTNVWYDLAEGRVDPGTLKATGARLVATPTSFLELASKMTAVNFPERQRAARAVSQHADDILCDTETRLTNIWGVARPDNRTVWKNGFEALATARNFSDIVKGVADASGGVIRRVNVRLANRWRSLQWESFKQDIEDAIETDLPGYKRARLRGHNKHMGKAARVAFEKKVFSPRFQDALLFSTYLRALLAAGLPPSAPDQAVAAKARQELEPYLAVYSRYLIGCACVFAPAANDLGDLECFIYLQGSTQVVTFEKRWIALAQQAGCGSLVFKP